ncbi:MAG: SDR family NAD(P)-dependent oxidoreductase [Sphingomonadales bacterium]|nr:MAG: SDR family NAD(P)-dependent oxidoreductase [Sphingomonadales bacterium]
MTAITCRHALVTGGGTGIGAAIARALAAEGAQVTVIGRRAGPIEQIARDIGGTAIAADATDRTDIDRVVADAGPFTILVNNAGLAESTPFAKVTASAWRQVMAVNLDAAFHCSQAALPGMLAAGHGRIVTIASIAGLRGGAYIAPYVAAKHGAVGLMRALAEELGSKGITANAICPGYADTEIVAVAARNIREKTGRSEEEARADLARFNPSGRLITPEEIADAVIEIVLSDRTGEAVEIA